MKLTTFIAYIIGISLGLPCGCRYAFDKERTKAIKAGVAQYTVDPKTGATQFVYLGRVEK